MYKREKSTSKNAEYRRAKLKNETPQEREIRLERLRAQRKMKKMRTDPHALAENAATHALERDNGIGNDVTHV